MDNKIPDTLCRYKIKMIIAGESFDNGTYYETSSNKRYYFGLGVVKYNKTQSALW